MQSARRMSDSQSPQAPRAAARVRRALWSPIVILETYLVLTVALFFLGPVDWYVPYRLKLLVFLPGNYGALAVGYWIAIRPYLRGSAGVDVTTPTHPKWLI